MGSVGWLVFSNSPSLLVLIYICIFSKLGDKMSICGAGKVPSSRICICF